MYFFFFSFFKLKVYIVEKQRKCLTSSVNSFHRPRKNVSTQQTLPTGSFMMYYKKKIISKFEYSLASVLSTNALLFLIASGVSLDLIYKSLNRTVLYQLSRPINTVSGQTMVLDSLHKLTSNRTLIFGPKNYDTEFLVCLCYCLLQLTEEDPEKRYMYIN